MNITAYDIAERFIGTKEVPGQKHNPVIMAMLTQDMAWPTGDEVPWCSAFVNSVAWLLGVPRSKSLRARSWLKVGDEVPLEDAEIGWDVVILKRGGGNQPGPDVIAAPGHVGFFAGLEGDRVKILGGNQSDSVNISAYPVSRVLGTRRLYTGDS